MIRTLTLAGAALIALAVPAVGQTTAALVQNRPVLKAEAVVTGDIVRIGDLIEHAGIVANIPIFRAPDLGSTGTVPANAVIEAVRAHQNVDRETACDRAREMLARVGIASPGERLRAYPHQFSGGMRQRVAVAIALINRPDLIIADEPTTALDVTIQGQILHEVQALCREWGTALIWITHDLAVISGLADEVMVMYAGKFVEHGTVDEVLDAPLHPYTRALIDSVPSRNPRGRPLKQIPGMTPSLAQLPGGCAFRERCPRASEICRTDPALVATSPGRTVRCFHPCQAQEPLQA